MNLCSFMCRAELLAQQPVLSGAVVFGACVCGRGVTSNVCSGHQGTCCEYQKALERQYKDICGRAPAQKETTYGREAEVNGVREQQLQAGLQLLLIKAPVADWPAAAAYIDALLVN